MLQDLLVDILLAYVLDLIIGDPYWLPHPVRFIGWLVVKTETFLRALIKGDYQNSNNKNVLINNNNIKKKEKLAGIALTCFVVFITFMIVLIILKVAAYISPALFHVINIYFIYSAVATKCLANEVGKIYTLLKGNDIVSARKQSSMLLRRETKNLNEKEIIDGIVDTTAENTVDGVISPLFYAIIGSFCGVGAPLSYAFKAVNTLDSMVGYKNEKYLSFGMFSAKTDDLFNYLPARLSGLIIPMSALFCGMSFQKSFSSIIRYRRNSASPNSAYPESAMAGALGIRFGGTYTYFGKKIEKLPVGDPVKEMEISDIPKAIKLMYISSLITIIIGVGLPLMLTL